MKKLIITVAAGFFTIMGVQAQDEVSIGAKAGVNFAKFQGDNVEDADGRTGFHIGAVVEIPITDKFSVQPEVMYSQQGLQSDFVIGNIETDIKTKVDYINVPVLAKFYATESLSFHAGPQFGFLAKAESETEIEGTDGDDISEGTVDIEDQFAGFDMGAAIGAEYGLNNGVFFQARYIIGLSNVNDTDEGSLFEDDLTNSNLQFSVGYKF